MLFLLQCDGHSDVWRHRYRLIFCDPDIGKNGGVVSFGFRHAFRFGWHGRPLGWQYDYVRDHTEEYWHDDDHLDQD